MPVTPRTDLGQSVLPDVEAGPVELTRDVLHLDDPDLQLVLAGSHPRVGQVKIAWQQFLSGLWGLSSPL